MYIARVIAIALACISLGCSSNIQTPVRVEPLGANIDGISDWSRTMVFSDIMKQSREFGKPNKPWEKIGVLDSHGWPTTDFGVILMADVAGVKGTGGTYSLSFECRSKPEIKAIASNGTIEGLNRSGEKWVAKLTTPEGQNSLMLSFTGTSGGVRNLEIRRPGASVGQFTKAFVDHVRRFGTLRFMDWGSTNGNLQEKWSQRSVPESPSFAGSKGVPYESMIDLANLTQADPWICVPEHADNEYIRSLAQLCKKRLDPKLKLYIENSNEVWNWGFEQAQHNLQTAKAEGPNDKALSWDGKNREWTWPARRIAKRLMNIRTIFAEVYGAQFKDCVRPILAGQIVWPENWLEQGLAFIEHNYGSPNKYIYAIAGAPYINLGKLNERKDLTKDEVLESLEKSVEAMPKEAKASWFSATMKKYDLKLVAYEAGPDTFGPNSIPAKKAAQFDPRMKQILLKYYRTWREMGGGLMNYFVAGATNFDGQYGTWGLTDDLSKVTPKTEAVDLILAGKWKQ